jgi:hypothetical protein
VTPDRLKAADAAGTKSDEPAASDKPAAPPKAKVPNYKIGEKLEAKRTAFWEKCTVVNRRGDWFLVNYDGWDWREWVEPWRLRPIGSTYDVESRSGNPRMTAKKMTDPPRPTPGDAPTKDKPAANDPFSAPDAGIPIKEAVRTGRTVAPAADAWAFKPAPAPKLTPAGPTVLPPLSDFFSGYTDLSLAGNFACVTIKGDRPGAEAQTGLVKVNLAAGTGQGIETKGASLPLALSPNGNLLVARSNGFHSKTNSRIDLYKIVERKATPVNSFFPDEGKADVKDAFFADDTHLITLAGDTLTCWDVDSLAAQWQILTSESAMARSPDGKIIAVQAGDGVALIDLADGKCVGTLDGTAYRSLSFSTDGQRLLGLNQGVLSVWNLADGKPLYTLGLPPGVSGNLLALDADNALVGPYLFSLTKKLPVWKYEGSNLRTTAGGRVFTLSSSGGPRDKNQAVASAVLPHPAAVTALKNAPDAPMVLHPGMKVSIDFQHEASDQQKQNAITKLTRKLNAADNEVVPGQPVVLTTRTEAGKSETREYEKRQGFDRSTESVTISSKVTTFSIVANGQPAWSVSSTFRNDPGYMVSLQKGESIQSKADAATINNDWIGDVTLPTYVAAPVNLETLPTSRWALGGVKDK